MRLSERERERERESEHESDRERERERVCVLSLQNVKVLFISLFVCLRKEKKSEKYDFTFV